MPNIKLITIVLYFINFLIIWRIEPALIYDGSTITLKTILWIWAVFAIAHMAVPELTKLFGSVGKTKQPKVKPTLGNVFIAGILHLGLIPAAALILISDFKLIFGI